MDNHTTGRAPGAAAALPEIHVNLSALSLADLNNLMIATAMAAAPKWRDMGVELTTHRLPVAVMSGENIAVQYLTTSSRENVVCHVAVELPSLPALAEAVSQKSIYQRGHEAMRRFFKKGDPSD